MVYVMAVHGLQELSGWRRPASGRRRACALPAGFRWMHELAPSIRCVTVEASDSDVTCTLVQCVEHATDSTDPKDNIGNMTSKLQCDGRCTGKQSSPAIHQDRERTSCRQLHRNAAHRAPRSRNGPPRGAPSPFSWRSSDGRAWSPPSRSCCCLRLVRLAGPCWRKPSPWPQWACCS